MALLTLLARASDGVPLSASIQDDDQYDQDLSEYQKNAKEIFRKLSTQSPPRCSIESNGLVFHYIIEGGVCYLALYEPSFPPRVAFSYLEAIHQAFNDQHSQEIYKATRPYHFIEFGTEINRIKRNYQDGQSRQTSEFRGLSDQLHGVQTIMFENIEAVIQRGELVENLSKRAIDLANSSKIFRTEAHTLNLRTSIAAKIAIVVVVILFIVFIRFWFF